MSEIFNTKVDGLQITWDVLRNLNICTKKYSTCLSTLTNCSCTIICAVPQIFLNIAKYKYAIFEETTFDTNLLINYGLIKRIYFNE